MLNTLREGGSDDEKLKANKSSDDERSRQTCGPRVRAGVAQVQAQPGTI